MRKVMKLLIITVFCFVCASIADEVDNSIEYTEPDYVSKRDEFERFPIFFKEQARCMKKEYELNVELPPILEKYGIKASQEYKKYLQVIEDIQDNFDTSFDYEKTQNMCWNVKNYTYELLKEFDLILKNCVNKDDKNYKLALIVLEKGFEFVCTLTKKDYSDIANLSKIQKCIRKYEATQDDEFKYKLMEFMQSVRFDQGLCDWNYGEIYEFIRNGLLLPCVEKDDFFVRSLDFIYNSIVEECNIYNASV